MKSISLFSFYFSLFTCLITFGLSHSIYEHSSSSPSPSFVINRSKYYDLQQKNQQRGELHLQSLANDDPQQIFVALSGNSSSTMIVSWITWSPTNASSVRWGLSSQNYTSSDEGNQTTWIDPNPGHTQRVIHLAHLTNLLPSTHYYYQVGDSKTNKWSSEYRLRTIPEGKKANDLVSLIVYGDLGVVNSVSMNYLDYEIQNETANLVLHVGDYAYNLDSNDGKVGDVFMNDIMNFSTRVPYMGVLGNHESAYNFSHFSNRFSAYNELGKESKSGQTNWWFSWEYYSGGALVHMTAVDSEVYYNKLTPQLLEQYQWLDQDLEYAKQKADWVIVYGHRPLYCSNVDDIPDCTTDAQTLREGINGTYGMESLFVKHSIDMYISAHEHSYERTAPVIEGNTLPYTSNHTYVNPGAPVYIISGSAGCPEGKDYFDHVLYGPWSIVRSATYGYGHLIIHNSTHLYWNQLLDEGNGGVDELWMIKSEGKKLGPKME